MNCTQVRAENQVNKSAPVPGASIFKGHFPHKKKDEKNLFL